MLAFLRSRFRKLSPRRQKFLREHSLSIALFSGFTLFSVMAILFEPGHWPYDFCMMMAGSFGGSAILVVLARFLWERGSDPSKPPED